MKLFRQVRNLLSGRHASGVRRCCTKPANLVPYQPRPDLVINKCQVCGSRHFSLTVDPGKIGLLGARVG